MDATVALDRTLHALADGSRRRILRLLRDDEVAAGEIARSLASMSRPAVSQHLRVLLDAELVEVRSAGRRRLYRQSPGRLRQATAELEGLWAARLDRLRIAAEAAEAADMAGTADGGRGERRP